MRRILLFLIVCSFQLQAQIQSGSFVLNPSTFEEGETVTLTVSGVNPQNWGVTDLYLWAWYFKNNSTNASGDAVNNGTWNNSNEAQKLTNNGDGTYSFTFVPTQLFNDSNITRMGVLVKAKDGTGDKKTQDHLVYVGSVQVNISTPSTSTLVINSGDNISVSATMAMAGTSKVGDFWVYFNNTLLTTGQGYPNFSTTISNVTQNGIVKVEGLPFGETEKGTSSFEVIIAPNTTLASLPQDLEEGINYHNDPTKATLVVNAPHKDFIYVAGSFNNYNPDNNYLMKKDPNSNLFWLELNGLISGEIYHYQYWVYQISPPTNAPQIVKTADPYSTLVLSPFDDPHIPSANYPNLPAYPTGQEREVTVLQTAKPDYIWQVTNFNKPVEEDLIVYEILVRDFDQNSSFQDLIDRIDYFKNLNINAIELMPVMEFEGNESWGYNTVFHLALDKYYGTENKLKEFIDLCHQNGIAVILDLALNHAFGRNPMVRMWMNDPDGDGWGGPNTQNPYFNTTAKHSYSVGEDFNHQQILTQNYTKRVVKHWINEFKIDGIRWDLTKGFTQNAQGSDANTNAYQQDRVDILKTYADYSWSLDPDHYVIFEHLGIESEEKEWANYRLNEGKGVMMWGKTIDPYAQLMMGWSSNSNISAIGHKSRSQFQGKRVIGYFESHDEERIMFRTLQYGNSSNTAHNTKALEVALQRMPAIGAMSLLIPGPKMIWHFGDLGMEQSLNTCADGSQNSNIDCKLDTKPQPQWTNNWLGNTHRKNIYDTWSKLIRIKTHNEVFRGDYDYNTYNSNGLLPRLYVWNNSLGSEILKNVVVVANFDVVAKSVAPGFPYTGTWYDLISETSFEVSSTSQTVVLQPGSFMVFGNQLAKLNHEKFIFTNEIGLSKNPVDQNVELHLTPQTRPLKWNMFDMQGKEVSSGTIPAKTNNTLINAPNTNGIYLLQISADKSIVKTLKVIKL